MGRVMSVASITSSAGRVIGPPLYGKLYMLDGPLAYRVAAALAAGASAFYFASHLVFARRPLTDEPGMNREKERERGRNH